MINDCLLHDIFTKSIQPIEMINRETFLCSFKVLHCLIDGRAFIKNTFAHFQFAQIHAVRRNNSDRCGN